MREIEGIILLDGTWSQAKALWWRNGWMLKCKRVVLGPKRPSRYGRLRREPRRDGLSTIEAAAMLLARLESKPEIETAMHASFERLLARYREMHPISGGWAQVMIDPHRSSIEAAPIVRGPGYRETPNLIGGGSGTTRSRLMHARCRRACRRR